MSKLKYMVIIVLLIIGAKAVCGADDPNGWKYQAQVTVQDTNNKYCGVTLTPEIYDAARPDLGDIRLIGSDGKAVPYILTRPRDVTETINLNPKVINRSTNADKTALLTLDFGRQTIKNSIEVLTTGDNFRRAVKIEGSNDNIEFFTLVEDAYVFAIGDKHNSRFSRIDLPENDFRYLRVGIAPMPMEEKSPVIVAAMVSQTKEKLAQRQTIKMAQTKYDEDKKLRLSTYEYDLGGQNLPVTEFTLDVPDESFYRYVIVDGRNAAKQQVKIDSEDNREHFKEVDVPWERIAGDTIYRFIDTKGEKRQNLSLHVPAYGKVSRYIKITIQNYDNNPLKVGPATASIIPHKLVFVRGDNHDIILYVGSQTAPAPQYDLKYILSNPEQVNAPSAQVSKLTDNPLFAKVKETQIPWTEKHKALLLIALSAVVIVLATVIIRSFKSIQSTQEQ